MYDNDGEQEPRADNNASIMDHDGLDESGQEGGAEEEAVPEETPSGRPKPSDAFLPHDGDDEADFWNESSLELSFLDCTDDLVLQLDDEELDMEHPDPVNYGDIFDSINNDNFDTVHPVPGRQEPDNDASSVDSMDTGDNDSVNDLVNDDRASINDTMSADDDEELPPNAGDINDLDDEDEEDDENKLITFAIPEGNHLCVHFILFLILSQPLFFFFLTTGEGPEVVQMLNSGTMCWANAPFHAVLWICRQLGLQPERDYRAMPLSYADTFYDFVSCLSQPNCGRVSMEPSPMYKSFLSQTLGLPGSTLLRFQDSELFFSGLKEIPFMEFLCLDLMDSLKPDPCKCPDGQAGHRRTDDPFKTALLELRRMPPKGSTICQEVASTFQDRVIQGAKCQFCQRPVRTVEKLQVVSLPMGFAASIPRLTMDPETKALRKDRSEVTLGEEVTLTTLEGHHETYVPMAAIQHLGSLTEWRHYTCHIRDTNRYYTIDDAKPMKKTTAKNLKQAQIVVFMKKK